MAKLSYLIVLILALLSLIFEIETIEIDNNNNENNIVNQSLVNPHLNSNLYDIIISEYNTNNDNDAAVIGNVGNILIKNKLINSTSLIYKYKLIYYSPYILSSTLNSILQMKSNNGSLNKLNNKKTPAIQLLNNKNSKELLFSIEPLDGNIKIHIPKAEMSNNLSMLAYLCQVKRLCACDACMFNLNFIYTTKNKLNANVIGVFIDDVNLHAPEFYHHGSYLSVNISEASELNDRIKLLNAAAYDRDAYYNKITYYLSYTNNSKNLVQEFSIETIDAETRNLNLIVNTKSLDYEKQKVYKFYLIAEDNGNGDARLKTSLYLIVNIIDENDNSPICENSLIKVNLNENRIVNNLIQIKANDADSGLNGQIEYYLRNINYNDNIDLSSFKLDKVNGWLSVIKPLNYKIQSNYLLTIKAKDMGTKNSYTTYCKLQINVLDDNDNQAKFKLTNYLNETVNHGYYASSGNNDDSSSDVYIYENNEKNILLAKLNIIDNDTIGNYRFSMSNENEFLIKQSNNDKRVYNLFALNNFSHTTVSTIVLNLTLFDLPIESDVNTKFNTNTFQWSHLVRVNILSSSANSPKFQQRMYEYTIDENMFNITINPKQDIQIENNQFNKFELNYELNDIVYSKIKSSDYIKINPQNARRPQLILKSPFDYESVGSKVEFELKVSDARTNNYDKTRIVIYINNLNDNSPKFLNENMTFHIYKPLKPFSYIGKILTQDDDQLNNSNISFHLMQNNLNSLFRIFKNGIITNRVMIDKQTINSGIYDMKIQVLDTNRVSNGNYFIHIHDLNENLPKFLYPKPSISYMQVNLNESVSVHDKRIQLFQAKAVDLTSSNTRLQYFISDSLNLLDVDSSNGNVYLLVDKISKNKLSLLIDDDDTSEEHKTQSNRINLNNVKETLNISITVKNINRRTQSLVQFILYLNFNNSEIPNDVQMIIKMDSDKFDQNLYSDYDDEIDIKQVLQPTLASSLQTSSLTLNDLNNKAKNFFQLVSNSVLIIILLVVLTFMILIACFILVTAYKRTLRIKRRNSQNKLKINKKADIISTLNDNTSNNASNNTSLGSSKLSLTNCIADIKSCLKTSSEANSTGFNSFPKSALLNFCDTNSSRKKSKIDGTIKSTATTVTTLQNNQNTSHLEISTLKSKESITVKDAPINDIDKIIMSENFSSLNDSNTNTIHNNSSKTDSKLSIGSVYNFNTKQISTIEYVNSINSNHSSQTSNLSVIEDYDTAANCLDNVMVSVNEKDTSDVNEKPNTCCSTDDTVEDCFEQYHRTYPKFLTQNTKSNVKSENFNPNATEYKELLTRQSHGIIKKPSNLIVKVCDIENQLINNQNQLYYNSNSLINTYYNLTPSTQLEVEDLKKYYAHAVVPNETSLNNSNNSTQSNQRCEIDKHLKKFEQIYNNENCLQSTSNMQFGPYTYTEF